jgi:hypothetical protein
LKTKNKKRAKQNTAGLINCVLCSSCCGIAFQLFAHDARLVVHADGQIFLTFDYGEAEIRISAEILEKQGRWLEDDDILFVRDENMLDISIKRGRHWTKTASFTFYYLGKASS